MGLCNGQTNGSKRTEIKIADRLKRNYRQTAKTQDIFRMVTKKGEECITAISNVYVEKSGFLIISLM